MISKYFAVCPDSSRVIHLNATLYDSSDERHPMVELRPANLDDLCPVARDYISYVFARVQCIADLNRSPHVFTAEKLAVKYARKQIRLRLAEKYICRDILQRQIKELTSILERTTVTAHPA